MAAANQAAPYTRKCVKILGHITRLGHYGGIREGQRGQHLLIDIPVGDYMDGGRTHVSHKRGYGSGDIVGKQYFLHDQSGRIKKDEVYIIDGIEELFTEDLSLWQASRTQVWAERQRKPS